MTGNLRRVAMEKRNQKSSVIAIGCVIMFFLDVVVLVTICGFGTFLPLMPDLIFQSAGIPIEQAEINIQDPFIVAREEEFHLSMVIPKYDKVISAIEQYYQDHGNYPSELKLLYPVYLNQTPGIYIRSGENLTYKPEPQLEDTPPFTFSVSGHYPFPASMHGWDLVYCPLRYSGCAVGGDRHIRSHRVNDRWIWIHSSAL
jgi:hypothetical protein